MDKHKQFMSDISTASTVVHNQLTRLNMLDKKFTLMDKELRHKIAANIKAGNNAKARALAIELSNIHRVQRTTQNVSLALEVVVIRFSTINEFAMVMETINPTIELIKDIQRDISNVVPSANGVISEVNSITSDVLFNSNIKLDTNEAPTPVDTEAISILSEVEEMLEDEAKVRLPEIPDAIDEIRIGRKAEKPVLDEKRVMVEG